MNKQKSTNLTKLDNWLWNFHEFHPIQFWLLTIFIGAFVFGLPLMALTNWLSKL